ncbi:MAG: hypothetical protein ACR2PG_10420 [Hyphomicrobiaceae bacterium]
MDHVFGVGVGLLLGLALGLILLAILGLVLQWLWNTTLPEIMGVKEVSFIQAIKILLIASILFGGHRVVAVQQIDGPANKGVTSAAKN